MISPEQAERNRQIEEGRRIAAREERERQEAEARARIAADLAAKHAVGTTSETEQEEPAETEAPKTKLGVVYVPTPEETVEIQAKMAEREANRLAAYRRKEAEIAKENLLAQANESRPSIDLFIQWVVGAGFDYAGDDGRAAVYVCEGVEIRAYGAAVNPDAGRRTFVRKFANEAQRLAAERINGLNNKREVAPETPTERAKREARRESLRAERIAAQPPKGKGGQKANPHGDKKPQKKGGK